MNIRERTANSIYWSGVQNILHRLISLTIFLILARLLNPEDFGLVVLAGVFVSFVELFIQVGFGEAIVQRKDLDSLHLDTAFWSLLGIGGLLTFITIICANPLSALFENEDLAPVIQWLSLSILIMSLSNTQEAILRRKFDFRGLAIRTLVASASGGVAGVLFAVNGMGVWSLVAMQLVNAFVSVVVLWTASDWRPRPRISRRKLNELFGYGIHIMGMNILHFVNSQSDRLIIGYFLGPVILGYYAVAGRLILIIQQVFSKTFVTVLFSTLSRLQDDTKKFRNAFLKTTQHAAVIVFPAFVFLAVEGPDVVRIIFGAKWENSSTIVQVLALAGLLGSITIFNSPVCKAKGRPSLSLRVSLVRSILSVILVMVAVQFGIVAVAVAILLREAIILPYSFFQMNKVFEFRYSALSKRLRSPLLASLFMVIGIYAGRLLVMDGMVDAVGLTIMILMSAIIYAVTLFIIDQELVRDAISSGRMVLAHGSGTDKSKTTQEL